MARQHQSIILGKSAIDGTSFGVSRQDLRRHLLTVGTTGSGKSTFLENLFLELVHTGSGATFIDPHGDSAERILDLIPPHRWHDVVYFNASDPNHSIAFNPLANIPHDRQATVAENIVSSFKGIWGDSWGPRMENIFIASVQTLLACQGETFLGINRLYSDSAYRARMVSQLRDGILRDFWETDYERYVKMRKDDEYTQPIKNKIGRIRNNPTTRHIFGQPRSKIHLDQILSRGKILVVNLSKGALGKDIANFLGSILISSIIDSAMSRQGVSERHRRDHILIVDEFHSFATPLFETALSEARKYHLGLALGLQFMAQLSGRLESTKHAVFGNVGSVISFKLGSHDADDIAKLFDTEYSPKTFVELDPYQMVAKLTTGGRTGQPFRGISLPPPAEFFGGRDIIIKRSQELFTTPQRRVERRINRWMGYDELNATKRTKKRP
jgi:type IV secretory pathway TraG/TraD family ATPase VirD4